jgi:hypothetical protein
MKNKNHLYLSKFRLLILSLFSFGCIETSGQQVSVLPQFFAANPIIKRDPTFENLQKYLTTAKDNTPLGLTENFSKKLEGVKKYTDKIFIKITIIEETVEKKKEFTAIQVDYSLFGKEKSSNFIKTNFNQEKDKLINELIACFVTEIPKRYPAFTEVQSANNTLNEIILYLISTSVKPEAIDITKFAKTDNEKFINEISENLEIFFENAFKLESDFSKDDFNNSIISINALIENIKTKIAEGLYDLQEIIDKTKSDISQTLVSANTGLGINQDEGSFGAGVILTFRSDNLKEKKNFQGAVFISGVGQAGLPDTTHVMQPFLCGVQLDYQTGKRTQFSVLSSYRYNIEKIGNKNWLFEIGGGFLTKTEGNIIWGVSAFYQSIDGTVKSEDNAKEFEISSLFTCGITIRGSANASPTILLGASHQKDWVPVMQISYPINFSKQ